MVEITARYNLEELAKSIDSEIRQLPDKNTPNIRAIRRKYSNILKKEDPELILNLGREIFKIYGYRWISYELIRNHKEAFKKIGEAELTEFGSGISHWGEVDAFAGIMAGPAWQKGQINDKLIHKWAHSEDRWWRRVALVSTVALNRRSMGGNGDVPRTLEICSILVKDKDDMVVKAMSWALRELIQHDVNEVLHFLEKYKDILASRVRREVMNKITTGLKTPKR
jgi:3-methyladenine DNA glycosylase AlkD